MFRASIAAALAFLTAACATYDGPRYRRADGAGDVGYYETRIDENRYHVQYRTSDRDGGYADEFVMRRAAELTLDRGYHWFQITSRNRYFSDDRFGPYDSMLYTPDYRDRPRYDDRDLGSNVAAIEILMGYNPPPRGSSIYDARRVLDHRYDRDDRS